MVVLASAIVAKTVFFLFSIDDHPRIYFWTSITTRSMYICRGGLFCANTTFDSAQ